MTIFGGCWESFNYASAPQMKSIAAMGFNMIRLMAMWPKINPEPGVFVWDRLDGDMSAVTAAGMAVYLDPYWCPSHASEGLPTYEPYNDGCTEWIDPKDPSKGIKASTMKSYCVKPAHIDPEKTRLFGQALARRYGSDVEYYGIWNEPGSIYYSPANLGGDWGKQLCDEVISPFVAGVKEAYPDAVIVGPEADSPDTLDGILRHESENSVRWFDHLTVHPYAWDKTAEIRLAEFQAVAARWNPGASLDSPRNRLWITEIGGPLDGGTLGFSARMKQANTAVVLFHELNDYCNEKGEPTALYEPMKQLIAS